MNTVEGGTTLAYVVLVVVLGGVVVGRLRGFEGVPAALSPAVEAARVPPLALLVGSLALAVWGLWRLAGPT